MSPLRQLLHDALAQSFAGIASKVARDGRLRVDGEGFTLSVVSAVAAGAFPRVEFYASAHLDHVGAFMARLRGTTRRDDPSLHFGHHEMFTTWGPAYGPALSARGPACLEVMGDDYPALHAAQLRAIVVGEVLPLVRRCAALEAYDALLNDAPESPMVHLGPAQRAARGVAARHLRGGRDLADLVARYERALAGQHPATLGEFDTVRRAVAAP